MQKSAFPFHYFPFPGPLEDRSRGHPTGLDNNQAVSNSYAHNQATPRRFTHRGTQAVKLVERELHLSSLKSMLAHSIAEDSRAAVLTGPVASGKSALAQALVEHAHDLGAQVLQTRCSPAEEHLRLETVRQLLDMRPKHNSVIEIPLGPSYSSSNPAQKPAPRRPLDPGRLTARDFGDLLLELSAEIPVLIVVDDFEYADETSAEYLSHAVRRIRSSRVMTVIATKNGPGPRTVRRTAELLRNPHCCPIRLRPLSRPAVGDLLTQRLGTPAKKSATDQHYAASGGNPLLLHALIDDLTARTPAPRHPEHLELTAAEHYAQAVITCLYRSTPDLTRTAAALAVLGDTPRPDLFEHLLQDPSTTAEQALQQLTASGTTTPGGRFRHPAARQAVLTATDTATRTELNLRAAHWLYQRAEPAPRIARHLLAAGHAREPWQTTVLREAAAEALHRQDTEHAVSCLELAHTQCTDDTLRTELTIELAEATWPDSPLTAMRRMLPLHTQAHDRPLEHRHGLALAKTLLRSGRFDAAQDVLDRLEPTPDPHTSTDLYIFDKWLETSYPRFGQRFRTRPAPPPPPQPLPTGTETYLHAIEMLATVLRSDAHDEVITIAEETLRNCPADDRTMEAASTLIAALFYADRTDTLATQCDRLLTQATQRHAPAWQAVLSSLKAQIAYRQGDINTTIRHARHALTAMSPQSWGVGIGVPLSSLLMGAAMAADHTTAEQALHHPVPETLHETRFGIHYRHARGTYYLTTGRPQLALRELLTCGDLMTQWHMDTPSLVPWRLDAAQAYLHLGRPDQAAQLLDEQTRTHPTTSNRITGMTLRLHAATQPPHHRTPLLHHAITLLTPTGDRLELTRALADQTHTHTHTGNTTAAHHTRRQTLDLINQSGATALHTLLQPQPPTPHTDTPQPTRTNPPATTHTNTGTGTGTGTGTTPHTGTTQPHPRDHHLLSTAEHRVATLVARGYTNRQVARHLYITNSTVEQHMTRVYRKLNITRRTDLPTWLTHPHTNT
ncbi:hypothetical protein CW362_42405 [Streptomyces populi]|uniref:HTH luxR-type domain-containing protein n=1 Tax=Streptomyces populi TaxID=2058924 RepID=A0A2I0SAZ3_9ACTN|nr:LuxR family transcriptional regulator [Streptomyces populi]PKT67089.1 hypothetical protein CW362_42405 [Streptomyces populi]